jgi:hypothetical protein
MEDKFIFEYEREYNPVTRIKFHDIATSRKMGRDFLERVAREGVEYMEKYPDVSSWHSWSGDTLVLITRDEDALDILVATPTMHGSVSRE